MLIIMNFLPNRYTINDRSLGRLLSQITTSYNTQLQLHKVSAGLDVRLLAYLRLLGKLFKTG